MAESINELKSYTEYNVSTPTSVFTIGFQYDYNVDHVNVYVDDVEATAAGYTVQHDSQGTITLTPAVPSGVVRLSRETDIDTSAHTFSAGAKFTAGNMDENFRQVRHSQQEVRDVVLRTASGFSTLDANATAALQAATTAVNTANSIDDKATTALSNSSTALSVANGVDAKATSALSSANTAVTAANTADANATTALNTANTAQSVANGIDAKATQAQSDASTALSTVTTQKGAAMGLAPLDANTKVDPIYLPSLPNTAIPKATETTLGVAKIATTAIAQAGVNDTDFITAKKLRDALNASGSAPVAACRAWVNFSASGGVITVKGSLNIASVTRVSAGVYTINFSGSMPTANYAVFVSNSGSIALTSRVNATSDTAEPTIKTVNSVQVAASGTSAFSDTANMSVGVFC